MDWLNMLAGLGKAFVDLSTPYGYWLITIGCAVGILGGALPGVSTTMTVALLAVFTYTMDPLWSIILLSATPTGGDLRRLHLRHRPEHPRNARLGADGDRGVRS